MRQVHYDPFGMRLAGYQAGVHDETGLQDNTRQARLADWQFNNTLPIELRGMRREDAFNEFNMPYRRNAAVIGDQALQGSWYDTERARRNQLAMTTGNWGLPMAIDQQRYPTDTITPAATHAVPSPANLAFDDWNALIQQEGLHPDEPIAQQYQAQLEQAYGLAPGALMDPSAQMGPQHYAQTPAVQMYTDPVTGLTYQFSTAPNAYEQRAFMPEAMQYANFGLKQDASNRADEYLNLNQGWQNLKAAGAGGSKSSAAAAPPTTYSGSDAPYWAQ